MSDQNWNPPKEVSVTDPVLEKQLREIADSMTVTPDPLGTIKRLTAANRQLSLALDKAKEALEEVSSTIDIVPRHIKARQALAAIAQALEVKP